MLPHQTQQYDGGDETKVVYSEVKITPEVKEDVATQVDEKVKEEVATQVDKEEVVDKKMKEAAQTDKKMQNELADQSNKEEMDKEESECMHVNFRESIPPYLRYMPC